MPKDRIILGIDPGTVIMGYGVISALDKKMELLAFDVLNLKSSSDHADKLKKIFEHTLALIDLYHPDEIALEEPFFGKDVQAMLKLGRAQGVAMAAALSRSIPIFGYSPRRIKKSITGNGNASKDMVAHVLMQLLHFAEVPRYLDATDGLAAAVCHFFQNTPRAQGKQYAGWEDFIRENPKRQF